MDLSFHGLLFGALGPGIIDLLISVYVGVPNLLALTFLHSKAIGLSFGVVDVWFVGHLKC